MVATPWGSSSSLREQMLKRGPGTPPEVVAENQRRRLFGAMVAGVSTRGYAETRLADLVDVSGVSSSSFYDLFADKHACFLATLEELCGPALARALDSGEEGGEAAIREGVRAFTEL